MLWKWCHHLVRKVDFTIEKSQHVLTFISKVPNSAILECPDDVDLSGKDFMNPREHEEVPFQEKGDEQDN